MALYSICCELGVKMYRERDQIHPCLQAMYWITQAGEL